MTVYSIPLKMDTDTVTQAWSTYVPGAISAGSGTITSANASGRFNQPLVSTAAGVQGPGKTVDFTMTINIVTAGTGAGTLAVVSGVPVVPKTNAVFIGREANTQKAVVAFIGAGGTNMLLTFADGTTPIATGNRIDLSGRYEAQ